MATVALDISEPEKLWGVGMESILGELTYKLSTQSNFLINLVIMSPLFIFFRVRGTMTFPCLNSRSSETVVFAHLFLYLLRVISAGLDLYSTNCIPHWQWVFPVILLGARFYSLHKSKDTIKATHQRAIKGTTHITMERMLLSKAVSANSLFSLLSQMQKRCCWCPPLQPPVLAHLKTPGSAHIICRLPQGPGPGTTVFPFLLLCGLCIIPCLLSLKTRGIGSCVPVRQPSSDGLRGLLFCS